MNENYFNKNKDEAIQLSSKINSFNTIPSILSNLFGGYVFDLFGRKYCIFFMLASYGVLLSMFPQTAPNEGLLIGVSMAINFICSPLGFAPLV